MGSLINFKNVKGSWDQKFENHCARQFETLSGDEWGIKWIILQLINLYIIGASCNVEVLPQSNKLKYDFKNCGKLLSRFYHGSEGGGWSEQTTPIL